MQPAIWAEGAWEPAILQKGFVAGTSSWGVAERSDVELTLQCEMSLHVGVTLWEIGALCALALVIQALSRDRNCKWQSFASHEH